MITLREDQLKAVNDVREAMRRHQSVLLNAGCGWGKTVASAYIAKSVEQKKKRVIFAVHRKELLRQTANTFRDFDIKFGYIAAGMRENPYACVQIASADTLRSRLHMLENCDLFVPDEAHLWGNGKTRLAIINAAREAGSKILPLTATPQCGNGKGLGNIADAIVEAPPVSWLIEQGFLAKYRPYAPFSPDMTGMHKRNGEYITEELDERLDKPSIVGDRVAAYRKYAMGKRHIGYCYSRVNGEKTAQMFREQGVPAVFIDGETPHDDRQAAIASFADGTTLVLLNCQLMREGFDLSAQVGRRVPIQSVGLYAPTKSTPMAIQMMMRPMRPQDDHAILIDHANIFRDHGLPDDDRIWDLNATGRGEDNGVAPTKVCKECSFTYRVGTLACPSCGHKPKPNPNESRQIEEVSGEIVEVDIEALRAARKADVRKARDLSSLAIVAVSRNYKPGWIVNMFKARGDDPPTFLEAKRAIESARE